MEIELAAYPYPWSRGIFSDCLRVGYDCWGLQLGLALVGYSVQSDAAEESHLLNLCVAPEWQRRGCGRVLLENAVRIARAHRCQSMYLEVRPSNPAGIALYARHGFTVVGRRPDYYSASAAAGTCGSAETGRGREDALVMRLGLRWNRPATKYRWTSTNYVLCKLASTCNGVLQGYWANFDSWRLLDS